MPSFKNCQCTFSAVPKGLPSLVDEMVAMTSTGEPDSDKIIVESLYFVNIELKSENLRKIQQELTKILHQQGYRQSDVDPSPFGPVQRTMDFHLFDAIPIEKDTTMINRVKGAFSTRDPHENEEISKKQYLEGLEKVRDDLPFRFIFYFRSYEEDDLEGYYIEVESIPVLLQKYRQLSVREDYRYNAHNIVEENKREIRRIMGRLGLEPLEGPFTKAESRQENSSSEDQILFEHNRISTLLNVIDHSDQFQQDYRKAVREFNNGEYGDAVRDIGRAGETLVEGLCNNIYVEEKTPDTTARKINKLDKSEDGVASFIGKTISPLWWLRNKANHPSEYEITEGDAHYALICFQEAVQTYVEAYVDTDADY